MTRPEGLGAVDLMIGFPRADAGAHDDYLRKLTKDPESASMTFPAEFLFKQVPNYLPEGVRAIREAKDEHDIRAVTSFLRDNAVRLLKLDAPAS